MTKAIVCKLALNVEHIPANTYRAQRQNYATSAHIPNLFQIFFGLSCFANFMKNNYLRTEKIYFFRKTAMSNAYTFFAVLPKRNGKATRTEAIRAEKRKK